ncbi:hypothetical protein Dsin_032708 [Dipteronia sinensis]|uniref:Uncharacterized protein n=1 Tax=Dipteronia sinensis TaxID=43782 RepID=A0AAE0DRV5_9ROSI|nr:hypothetical protein Dsin_032708 [Dipteronia sinensis]
MDTVVGNFGTFTEHPAFNMIQITLLPLQWLPLLPPILGLGFEKERWEILVTATEWKEVVATTVALWKRARSYKSLAREMVSGRLRGRIRDEHMEIDFLEIDFLAGVLEVEEEEDKL